MQQATIDFDMLLPRAVAANVTAALEEDLGDGDVNAALVPAERRARARIITRENGVFCGRPWADETCRQVDARITIDWRVGEGERIAPGQTLAELEGPARGLLSAERTVLNFLQLLCGTATQSARYAERVADLPVTLLDTRKTVPGLRVAQKYAVRCGGCANHRMGLFDAFLIKENHIAAAGSITAAIHAARAEARTVEGGRSGEMLVEIEVERLDQLPSAIEAGADIILLDNFTLEALRDAVTAASGSRARLEASGGIDFETLRSVAETGVDYISIGEMTKRVIPLDLSMRFID